MPDDSFWMFFYIYAPVVLITFLIGWGADYYFMDHEAEVPVSTGDNPGPTPDETSRSDTDKDATSDTDMASKSGVDESTRAETNEDSSDDELANAVMSNEEVSALFQQTLRELHEEFEAEQEARRAAAKPAPVTSSSSSVDEDGISSPWEEMTDDEREAIRQLGGREERGSALDRFTLWMARRVSLPAGLPFIYSWVRLD